MQRPELPYTETIRAKIVKAIKETPIPENANIEFVTGFKLGIEQATKLADQMDL